MEFPRPEVDILSPPAGFDELAEWFERWSTRLVLLEEYPLGDVRRAILVVERAVREHRQRFDPWASALPREDAAVARGVQILLSDHAWFETSIAQLWWFYDVVDREDHGGHRQALGQFGRVFAEALGRHRADERRLEALVPKRVALASPASKQP